MTTIQPEATACPRSRYRQKLIGGLVLALGLMLSGCASNSPNAPYDPYESFNRKVFKMNLALDRNVARPLAQGYVAVVPKPAREGVHNFLGNLDQPVIFINKVLQGEPDDAGDTLARFFVDSTAGIGGLINVASLMGIPDHSTDFGITLGRWGINQGPFLMLPLIGPTTPRDLTGMLVDIGLNPSTYIQYRSSLYYGLGAGFLGILDARAQRLGQVESLEQTSLDFYATTRNLYLQYRAAKVNRGKLNIQNLPNF